VENEWFLVSVRFQQESLSAIKRGGCPLSPRIRVRFQQELLSAFSKNCCPFSAGMSVRFGQEYAIHQREKKRLQIHEYRNPIIQTEIDME
jgi:hypothetical protein